MFFLTMNKFENDCHVRSLRHDLGKYKAENCTDLRLVPLPNQKKTQKICENQGDDDVSRKLKSSVLLSEIVII